MDEHTLNFVEGDGISVQAGPNPSDPDVIDVEISALPDEDPPAAVPRLLARLYGPVPGSPGPSGMYRVPYIDGAAVTFTLSRAALHLETAGSTTTTVLVEKSSGSGSFLAVLVATLTLAASATEVDVTTSLGTLTSGDLLRWRWAALGTGAQSFHAQLEGSA
jgi:hypothetical protein